MAGRKSTKPATKATETAEVEAIEPKAEEIKTEKIAEPKESPKAPAKKTAAKTTKAVKKAEEPKVEEAKAAAPKTKEKKAPVKAATKKVVEKCTLHIQYGGKAYSQEDLLKIAKDVWKYDLKRKAGDLENVELYVKPEENKVYYVMNGESGSFDI